MGNPAVAMKNATTSMGAAANEETFHAKMHSRLDKVSAALALASAIPVVNEAAAALQVGVTAAKVINHTAAGKLGEAAKDAVAGLALAGAEVIPGGGVVATLAKTGLRGAGNLVAASDGAESKPHNVSGGETVQHHETPSGIPRKLTTGKHIV